jgi:hypothetical protein
MMTTMHICLGMDFAVQLSAPTSLVTASCGNAWALSHSPAFGESSESAKLRHISYTIRCSSGSCEWVV